MGKFMGVPDPSLLMDWFSNEDRFPKGPPGDIWTDAGPGAGDVFRWRKGQGDPVYRDMMAMTDPIKAHKSKKCLSINMKTHKFDRQDCGNKGKAHAICEFPPSEAEMIPFILVAKGEEGSQEGVSVNVLVDGESVSFGPTDDMGMFMAEEAIECGVSRMRRLC